MAVSSVSSSSSIYGTRNVISGLASGMDTESLIENAVSGYKTKISTLQQKRTKTEWKQEAYRSMINKMSLFSEKYTSYNSANNLMSTSFFNQAVKTIAKGSNASMVSASGRSSSDIRIDRIKQLATSATYNMSGANLDPTTSAFGSDAITASASGSMDLDKMMDVSNLNGSLTMAYGGSSSLSYLTINFDETKTYASAQDLADEINNQLKSQNISVGTTNYTGDELLDKVMKAEVKDGKIVFTDPKGNGVKVSRASGSAQQLLLGGQDPSKTDIRQLNAGDTALAKSSMSTFNYLVTRGGDMEVTLDGVSKSISLPGLKDLKVSDELKAKIENNEELTEAEKEDRDKAYVDAIQKGIDDAFGKNSDGSSKLKVSDVKDGPGIQFQFETTQKGSTFAVSSTRGEVLGFGASKRVTSYLNTGKTLGELMGADAFKGLEVAKVKKTDDYGNIVETDEEAVDANGKKLYSFKVNGKEVGQFNEDSTLDDVINTMNSNSDSGVKVSFSKLTNGLTFTAKDTGENSEVRFEGFSEKLFGTPSGDNYKKGQDAIFEATVNGVSLGEISRSSNSVEMDGLTVNLKGVFGYATKKDENGDDLMDENGNIVYDFDKKVGTEGITFETSSDADKIVDVIKQMVADYNAMVTEIKNAYSTLPAQQSNGTYYEPLTEDEEADASESFINNWNEKAKQGLLFGDRDLATLYDRLTSAVSMTGEYGATLRAAGITVSYSNGLSTLDFDEDAFRAALDKDPDAVRDAFTASTESGAKANGLMQALKEPLDLYGKTSGGKGILVEKAGSPLASSTMYNNTIQQELDDIDEQISKWQDKMSDKVDYYTNQFSRLEQLIQQMNSQSSYFSQLMG